MTKKPEHYLYEQNERFNVDTLFGFNDYVSNSHCFFLSE